MKIENEIKRKLESLQWDYTYAYGLHKCCYKASTLSDDLLLTTDDLYRIDKNETALHLDNDGHLFHPTVCIPFLRQWAQEFYASFSRKKDEKFLINSLGIFDDKNSSELSIFSVGTTLRFKKEYAGIGTERMYVLLSDKISKSNDIPKIRYIRVYDAWDSDKEVFFPEFMFEKV